MSAAPAVAARLAGAERALALACIALAGAFFWWSAGSAPEELREATMGVARFRAAVGSALVTAVLVVAALALLRADAWLARLASATGFLYLGALKAAGIGAAPWLALGLALAAMALLARRRLPVTPSLLLAHAMGALTGLYLAFSLERYLAGWMPLLDVLRGLRLLAG